jgi:predicted nuclease with TOPRIM domain
MSSVAIENEIRNAAENADVQAAAFQVLEQRVLRAIELLRKERELRAAAESHFLELEMRVEEQSRMLVEQAEQVQSRDARLADFADKVARLEADLSLLNGERDQVRERVERLLQHLDEFTGG